MTTNTTSNSKQFYAFYPDNEVTLSTDWNEIYPIDTVFYNPKFTYPWSIATEDQRNFMESQTITDDYVPKDIRAKALLLKK
jgi:hypothetical protein